MNRNMYLALILAACQGTGLWAQNEPVKFEDPPYDYAAVTDTEALFKVRGAYLANGVYQWYENGAPLSDGAGISGSASQSLRVMASPERSGRQYTCRVSGTHSKYSDPLGPTLSPPAMLTVIPSMPALALVSPTNCMVVQENITYLFKAPYPGVSWQYDFAWTAGADDTNITYYAGLQVLSIYLPNGTPNGSELTVIASGGGLAVTNIHPTIDDSGRPIAQDDVYDFPQFAIFPGYTFDVSTSNGVLANDLYYQGGPLTAELVAPPSVGALTFNADGSFTYEAVQAGQFVFSYRNYDGLRYSRYPADVTLVVQDSPGDVNRDGVVNALDLEIVTRHFGRTYE